MRADELRSAVVRVTEILKEADLAGAINALRAAKGDARAGAATRLRLLGTQVGKRFQALNAPEKLVVKQLHLTSLASAAYWEELHAASSTSERVHPEVVIKVRCCRLRAVSLLSLLHRRLQHKRTALLALRRTLPRQLRARQTAKPTRPNTMIATCRNVRRCNRQRLLPFELPAQPSSAASAPKTNSVEGLLQALGKGRDDA